jgi:hypothetical protein
MSIQTRLLLPLITGIVLLSPTSGEARKKGQWGEGLSVDVEKPYEQVLKVVREVVNDGIIRGTSQYKGMKELQGAESAEVSNAFAKWTEGGEVLYKVRIDALAPEHFHESNDQGTVTVRYIVQPAGASSTKLRIDAIFVENDRRQTHASDSLVESSEFAAISAKLKEMEEREANLRAEAAHEQQEKEIDELQARLDSEQAQLRSSMAREQQLQQELKQRQNFKSARVRTASADLKASPYNQSKTLQLLSQGEGVTILLQTANWCRIETSAGVQGWIYRLMLEVAP